MAEPGYGRNPPIDYDTRSLGERRSAHQSAVFALARRHDSEHRRIERLLDEVDEAIVAGMRSIAEDKWRAGGSGRSAA
jgi:hypothetical protein